MDIVVFFPDVFDLRQLVRLIVVRNVFASQAVGVPSFLESSIVQLAAAIKRFLQAFLLLASRIQSKFVGLLTHASGSRYTAS